MDIAVLDREVARLQSIFDAMPILADILRSDVLYYEGMSADQFIIAAHAQPHSITSLYAVSRTEQIIYPDKESLLFRAHKNGKVAGGWMEPGKERAGIAYQEVWPLYDHEQRFVGELSFETARVEHESAARRSPNVQRALLMLKDMAARGYLRGAKTLTPFTASDGLIVVGPNMDIQYTSNVAQEIYGRLGITRRLSGQRLDELETGDEVLFAMALETRACVESDDTVRDAMWVRRAIPLFARAPRGQRGMMRSKSFDSLPDPKSALLLVRDVTVERQRKEDRERLDTMSKEIHHRVKNNLQTIISLARAESRRSTTPETKRALEELSNRIFAIAQVHEFLSAGNLEEIQLKDISRQIAKQMRDSLLPRDSRIIIEVEGDPVTLAPRQATACALIINELVQNAVEHAFEDGVGIVRIQLEDGPEQVRIAVADNGRGLPAGYEWRHSERLGLKIVHTLVQDLHGELRLRSQESPAHGLIAQITLSKMLSKGK